jgi:FixJ family two-component response regulator
MDKRALISVVVDDESMRESLSKLPGELGFAGKAFNSGEAFGCRVKSEMFHQLRWAHV